MKKKFNDRHSSCASRARLLAFGSENVFGLSLCLCIAAGVVRWSDPERMVNANGSSCRLKFGAIKSDQQINYKHSHYTHSDRNAPNIHIGKRAVCERVSQYPTCHTP